MEASAELSAQRSLTRSDLRWGVVFALVVVSVSVIYANAMPFWFDEIATICEIRVAGLSGVWSVLCHGPDPNPPLSFVIFKAARSIFGEDPIGLRLPSMAGFLVGALALFAFTRRRFPARFAWCSALILFASEAFAKSYEARAYAIYFGIAGVSLLCWQVAAGASGTRRGWALAGLVISLAAGISTHWFFILMLAPLCMGEATRSYMTTKRPDIAVWLAFGLGFVPLLFYGPLIRNGRDFSGSFWARPTLHSLVFTYVEMAVKPTLLVALAAVACLLPRSLRSRAATVPGDEPARTGLLPHELAAAVGLSGLPVFGCLLAVIMHGGYTPRYVVPGYLGLALLATEAIYRADRLARLPRFAFPAVLIVFAVVTHGYLTPRLAKDKHTWPVVHVDPPRILDQTDPALPVVLTDSHQFLKNAYYRSRGPARSYSYILFDEPKEDTTRICMTRMRPLCDFDIEEYEEFLPENDRFYLVARPDHPVRKRLVEEGCSVELVRSGGEMQLVLVNAPATKVGLKRGTVSARR